MKEAVFADFDGTVTARETFVAVLRHFAPDLSARLIPEMYALRVSLRHGVREILESVPSESYPEILEFVRDAPLRPGLQDLLVFLEGRGVPFVILSGGLRGIVETVLGTLLDRIHAVHALEADLSGPRLRVHSDLEDGTELVSKVKAMQRYPARERIAVGDSLTDLNMALQADVVFARDRLMDYLDERGKPYLPWEDFFDVRDRLAERWPRKDGTDGS